MISITDFRRFCSLVPAYNVLTGSYEWDSIEIVTLVNALTHAQGDASQRSYSDALAISIAIRNDLSDLMLAAADRRSQACIDAARFLTALIPMQMTIAQGLHGDCYGWTLGAIARDHNPALRVNQASYGLPPFHDASDSLNAICVDNLTTWIEVAFILARKFGGLDSHARDFFDYSTAHCFSKVLEDPNDSSRPLEALVAVANWAVNCAHPKAKELSMQLLQAYKSLRLEPRTKVRIATLFTTQAGFWTGTAPHVWANKILSEHRADLVEHEVVQMLALSIQTLKVWEAHKATILAEIRSLANLYRREAEDIIQAEIALESRFSIINPLIFNLCTFGSTEDLMDLLWAWYGRSDYERASADILFIGSAHDGKIAYVWPGGRFIADPIGGSESLENFLSTISNALNEYFRGPAGDRSIGLDERLAGAPAMQHGPELERHTVEHYRLDLLAEQLPHDFKPRALVVVPAHRDPLQAMVEKVLGRLYPLEATLARAQPQRLIRTISIWPGQTFHTDAEVEIISVAAEKAGWNIRLAPASKNAADFRKFYEDKDADVLWVIGHGEQSPYDVDATGIILGDGSLLALRSMIEFEADLTGRRLLVLNICSSGATQNSGGIAHVGLGHALASPTQKVIAHLWPIDHYAALAFGSLLALNLTTSEVSIAMAKSSALLRNHRNLLKFLDDEASGSEAIRRLSGNGVREHLENVLSWGCPVILT